MIQQVASAVNALASQSGNAAASTPTASAVVSLAVVPSTKSRAVARGDRNAPGPVRPQRGDATLWRWIAVSPSTPFRNGWSAIAVRQAIVLSCMVHFAALTWLAAWRLSDHYAELAVTRGEDRLVIHLAVAASEADEPEVNAVSIESTPSEDEIAWLDPDSPPMFVEDDAVRSPDVSPQASWSTLAVSRTTHASRAIAVDLDSEATRDPPTSRPATVRPLRSKRPPVPADSLARPTSAAANQLSAPRQDTRGEFRTATRVALGVVTPPDFRGNDRPPYPPDALARRFTGVVRVRIAVDDKGRVVGVDVVDTSGYAILDAAAVDSLRRWTGRPAMEDGRPIAGEWEMDVRFDLD